MPPAMPKSRSIPTTELERRLQEFWSTEQAFVETALRVHLCSVTNSSERLYEAMRHAVLAGGKRLRPILCLAANRSLGGGGHEVYSVAAAIEMVHTYSLIHDDLPCMDDDDQRRGHPTVHVAFDEATAVLAGDALQALAFQILAANGGAKVVGVIAAAVGPSGMAGGQMADLEAEGETATEELVADIHRQKTGELVLASVLVGGLMAKAGDGDLSCLERYALPLGLAFQIVDDILELTETAEKLGKPVGSDLKHKKMTYPAAVGLERAQARAIELAAQAKSALDGFSGDPTMLLALADFIVSRDR